MTRPDEPSAAPPYVVDGVTFHQWITDNSDRPGTSKYVWRDATNRLSVGRHLGKPDMWVAVDGAPVRGLFTTLAQGMRAAINAKARRAA
jgi:hypothetical protein